MSCRQTMGLGILLLLSAGSASAQVVLPAWERRPEPGVPAFANTILVDGHAVLNCVVSTSGTLTDCEVMEEAPAGLGFADAALDATAAARLTPKTVDGVAEAARVNFRVHLATDLDDPPTPQPYAGPQPSEEAMRLATRVVQSYSSALKPEMAPEFRLRDAAATAQIEAVVLEQMEATRVQAEAVVVLGVARTMPVEQMTAFLEGRLFVFPSQSDVERATEAEAHVYGLDLANRMRTAWCARHGPCTPIPVDHRP